MVKPDYCSWCGSQNLVFVKDNIIFNPDLDTEEKMDSYVCQECKTIHIDNKDFSFIQREVETNKLLQIHDNCNIV